VEEIRLSRAHSKLSRSNSTNDCRPTEPAAAATAAATTSLRDGDFRAGRQEVTSRDHRGEEDEQPSEPTPSTPGPFGTETVEEGGNEDE
jgi:hypothetical protein